MALIVRLKQHDDEWHDYTPDNPDQPQVAWVPAGKCESVGRISDHRDAMDPSRPSASHDVT